MDICIISRETIVPSSSSLDRLKAFKLSLLDQTAPPTYIPLIHFFPSPSAPHFQTQLKSSLSETLSAFYPFSGRTNDNLHIDGFDKGVRFIEARVIDTTLSDYLQRRETETLNQLLSGWPSDHLDPKEAAKEAQVVVQLNHFDCGGIALATSFSHKIVDGITRSCFLDYWAATSRRLYSTSSISHADHNNEIKGPDLSAAALRFPPLVSIPQQTSSPSVGPLIDKRRRRTKRFVFNSEAVAMLKLKSRSREVDNPTRVEALTAFVWKSAVSASKSVTGISRPTLSLKAVNLRNILNPPLPNNSIGNLAWLTVCTPSSTDKEMELQDLVHLQRENLVRFKHDFPYTLQSKGVEVILQQLKRVGQLVSETGAEVYGFSSWLNMGVNEIDFGWGKPVWVGFSGEVRSNITIFKELGKNNAVEAWVTLEEEKMSVLENDPEFLAFASPNPSILEVE